MVWFTEYIGVKVLDNNLKTDWNRLTQIEDRCKSYSIGPKEDIEYVLERLNQYKEQATRAMVLFDHFHFRCQYPEDPCDWDVKAKNISENIGKLIVEDRQ